MNGGGLSSQCMEEDSHHNAWRRTLITIGDDDDRLSEWTHPAASLPMPPTPRPVVRVLPATTATPQRPALLPQALLALLLLVLLISYRVVVQSESSTGAGLGSAGAGLGSSGAGLGTAAESVLAANTTAAALTATESGAGGRAHNTPSTTKATQNTHKPGKPSVTEKREVLWLQSLQGSRIFIMGDSMMRKVFVALIALLRGQSSIVEHYTHDSMLYTIFFPTVADVAKPRGVPVFRDLLQHSVENFSSTDDRFQVIYIMQSQIPTGDDVASAAAYHRQFEPHLLVTASIPM